MVPQVQRLERARLSQLPAAGAAGRGHQEMTDYDFWMAVRQALLMVLDALERMLEIEPRTAELRGWYKQSKIAAE
jgi:hypothetical protein